MWAKCLLWEDGRPESESPRVTQKPGKVMHTSNSRAIGADGRRIWEDPRKQEVMQGLEIK